MRTTTATGPATILCLTILSVLPAVHAFGITLPQNQLINVQNSRRTSASSCRPAPTSRQQQHRRVNVNNVNRNMNEMVTGFSNIALSLHHKNDCGGCYLTSRASLVLFQAANIIFNRIHQIQGNKMINNNNCQNNPIQYARQKLKHARNKLPQIAGLFLSVFALSAKQAFAMGVPSGNAVIKKMDRRELMGSILLFCSLFIVLALLHAVEISITTLYPWKVRDFAEEEGGKGTFTTLNDVRTCCKLLESILSKYNKYPLFARMLLCIHMTFIIGIYFLLCC